jgi:hypothetical protein
VKRHPGECWDARNQLCQVVSRASARAMGDLLTRRWDAHLCLVALRCLGGRPCLAGRRRLRDATCLLKGVRVLTDG